MNKLRQVRCFAVTAAAQERVARNIVRKYLRRLMELGMDVEGLLKLDDTELNARFGIKTSASENTSELNEDYAAFAEHHGCTVIPARVRKPRNKALVEGAVMLIYRSIYPAVREPCAMTCARSYRPYGYTTEESHLASA